MHVWGHKNHGKSLYILKVQSLYEVYMKMKTKHLSLPNKQTKTLKDNIRPNSTSYLGEVNVTSTEDCEISVFISRSLLVCSRISPYQMMSFVWPFLSASLNARIQINLKKKKKSDRLYMDPKRLVQRGKPDVVWLNLDTQARRMDWLQHHASVLLGSSLYL